MFFQEDNMIYAVTLISFALPIGAMIFWKKRTGVSNQPFIVGAACFVLFAMILEQVLHTLCIIPDHAVSRAINGSPVLFTLYGALAAGIFEETGRWFGFRVLLRRYKEKENSVAYGIGHGGIEVILLVGLTYLMMSLAKLGVSLGDAQTNAMILESAAALSPVTAVVVLAERVTAMMLHIGLSIMVFASVNIPGKKYLYPAAILAHAAADVPAALFQYGTLKSLAVTEMLAFVSAIAVLCIGVHLYSRMPRIPGGGQG